MKKILKIVALLLLTFSSSSLSAEADKAKGKDSYVKLCVTCHGETGAGDGPVGAALPEGMKPRNFQKDEFKFATDLAKFTKLVKEGGAAVGLNALMPAQADVTDEDIANIYAYVLSLKK